MPGATNNTNLLAASNQLIVVLNEISSRLIFGDKNIAQILSELELTSTVNFDTEAIADAITSQTTMQEERSIAEVTGQNTNFSDLVTAVNGLELIANCAPDVNVNCGSGGGCGCGAAGAGTQIPTDPETAIIGAETPPVGYEPYTPEVYVDEFKCKLAFALVDDVIKILGVFSNLNVVPTVAAGFTIVSFGVGIALEGAVLLVMGINVLAYIPNIIKALAGMISGTDVDDLITIIEENRSDIACVLYNGQNGQSMAEMAASLRQTLADAGADFLQQNLFAALLDADVLAQMYFEPVWYGIPVEARLEGYTGAYDCSGCAEMTPGVFDFSTGEHGWLIDEANSTNGVYDTVAEPHNFVGNVEENAASAQLTVYYPELSSMISLKAFVTATLDHIRHISVLVATDLEGAWTTVADQQFVDINGITEVDFTGLNITNKYVKLNLEDFWNYPIVRLYRVEFVGE